MAKVKYLIVGAGISGLSFAHHAKDDFLIIEKTDSPGARVKLLAQNCLFDRAVVKLLRLCGMTPGGVKQTRLTVPGSWRRKTPFVILVQEKARRRFERFCERSW